jgi:hypothetical protein
MARLSKAKLHGPPPHSGVCVRSENESVMESAMSRRAPDLIESP